MLGDFLHPRDAIAAPQYPIRFGRLVERLQHRFPEAMPSVPLFAPSSTCIPSPPSCFPVEFLASVCRPAPAPAWCSIGSHRFLFRPGPAGRGVPKETSSHVPTQAPGKASEKHGKRYAHTRVPLVHMSVPNFSRIRVARLLCRKQLDYIFFSLRFEISFVGLKTLATLPSPGILPPALSK